MPIAGIILALTTLCVAGQPTPAQPAAPGPAEDGRARVRHARSPLGPVRAVGALGPAYVPGEVLVELREGQDASRALEGLERLGRSLEPALPGGAGAGAGAGAEAGAWTGRARLHRLRLGKGVSVPEALAALRARPGVAHAQPNFLYEPDVVPNDPRYGEQYAHQRTQAEAAWDITTGSASVVIAVIGVGVDIDHPDLNANIWVNPGEIPGNGLDDDSNGFVDDVHGWDFASNDNNPRPGTDWHETMVAGVAAAVGNNAEGVCGVSWRAKIMCLRTAGTSSTVAAAVDYARENGAWLVNMSFGSYAGEDVYDDPLLRASIDAAYSGGVLLFGTAGNHSIDNPRFPAAFRNVVALAMTTSADQRAPTSNYGLWVDMAAPGYNVLGVQNGGAYGVSSGTSFAAPYAAGIAALVWSRHPTLTNTEVRAILESTTDPIAVDQFIGTGRANAFRSVSASGPIYPWGEIAAPFHLSQHAAGATVAVRFAALGELYRIEYGPEGGPWTLIGEGDPVADAGPDGLVDRTATIQTPGTYVARLTTFRGAYEHVDRKRFSVLGGRTLLVPGDHATIQAAVDASFDGDTILVGPGTYVEDVLIVGKDIVLRSEDGPGATVIQGTGATNFAVVTIANGADAILEGFAITGGDHEVATGNPYNEYPTGGGVDVQRSSPTIRGCWVHGNYAKYGGGGICLTDSHARVEKNRIFDNTGGRGVGLRCFSFAAGTYAPVILNNLIYGNRWVSSAAAEYANHGGGVGLKNMGALLFAGNTVWGNSVPADGGGAALFIEPGVDQSPNVRLHASIFWGNVGPSTLFNVSAAQVFHSDIEAGGALVGVNGNIGQDPLLVAPANTAAGDFHLRAISPCIDAAVETAQLTDDLDGDPRDREPDMGADEFVPFVVPPPTGLSCTLSGADVSLAWTNGASYDSILIRRDDADLTALAGTATAFVDPGVPPGDHVYEVIGIESDVASDPASCEIGAPIAPPSGLACTPSAGSYAVQLAWTNGQAYDSVTIRRNGAFLATLPGSPAAFVDTVPAPGSYSWDAYGSVGGADSTRASCGPVSVTYVPPVTGLTCVVNANRTAALSWTNGSASYTSIAILLDGAAVAGSPFPGGTTTYASAVLVPGSRTFTVRPSIGAYAATAATCAVSVPTAPPTALSCVPSPTSYAVQLSWTNGQTYDKVTLRRNGAFLASLTGSPTTFNDTVPGPGSYSWEVSGTVGTVESTRTSCGPVEVTYVPPVTGLSCVLNPNGSATLSWTNGSSSYTAIAVLLDGAPAAGSPLAGTATTFTSAVLAPGAHTFAVRPAIGSYTATAPTCGVNVPTAPPTALSCVPSATSYAVQLSWTNGQTYDSVTIRRNGSLRATISGSPTTYSDTVSGPGSYSWEVSGTVGTVESTRASSGPVEVTYVPPVTGLSCVLDPNGSATLSWTNGSSSYSAIAVLLDGAPAAGSPLGGTATTYTSAVLAPGAHTFAVRPAIGAYTAAAAQCGVGVGVAPPSLLVCAPVAGSYTVALSWQNGQTYDSVTIRRNGSLRATISGSPTTYNDTVSGPGSYSWEVRGTVGAIDSSPASSGPVEVTYVPPVTGLSCVLNPNGTATLSWTNGSSSYSAIAVLLDGAPAAGSPLGGTATTYTSAVLAPGAHTFAVRPAIGSYTAAAAQCGVGVGVAPPSLLVCAPVAGSYTVALSWQNGQTYDSVTIRRNGSLRATISGSPTTYNDTVSGPGSYSWEVSGTVGTVESTRASSGPVEVTYVPPVTGLACVANADRSISATWQNGSAAYTGIAVLVDGVEAAGSPLPPASTSFGTAALAPGAHAILVRPLIGGFAAAAAGCGAEVAVPPPSGLSAAAAGGSFEVGLSWTNGWAYDRVTVLRDGVPTVLSGAPVSATDAVPGPGTYAYVVYGSVGSLDSARVAASPVEVAYVPGPEGASCLVAGASVQVSWTNGWTYDEVVVLRDGAAVATLAGSATTYGEELSAAGSRAYEVRGRVTGVGESAGSSCAADVVPPAGTTALSCAAAGGRVSLAWTNGASDYTRIEVLRDGETIAALEGGATSHEDANAATGPYLYEVRAYYGEIASASAPSCDTAGRARFVRADSNGDGDVDIADAIFLLRYLFLGGEEPPCMEAADSNDDASVGIADAIRALGFLFRGDGPPAQPYPYCGFDPDPDPERALPCETTPACR